MAQTKLLSLLKTACKSITLVRAIYALVVVFLALSALWGWYRKPQVINVPYNVYVPVPQIQEVVKVKKEYVYVDKGQVQVLNKEEAIKRLDGFPAGIKDDKDKQITSTGVIPPYKGKTNVVNVIDTKSGISEIMAKQVALPLFAIEQERYAGVRIGSTGQVTGFIEWGFARVGKLHAGAYGQYGTKDGAEVGIIGKIEF